MAYLNNMDKDINNKKKGKPGIYGLEYAIMLLVITTALVIGYTLVRYSVAGRMRSTADSIGAGMQYEPRGEHKTNITEIDSVCIADCRTNCLAQAESQCNYSSCGHSGSVPSCCTSAVSTCNWDRLDQLCRQSESNCCNGPVCDNDPNRCDCGDHDNPCYECLADMYGNCSCNKQCMACPVQYGCTCNWNALLNQCWQNAYHGCCVPILRDACITACIPTCTRVLN